MKFIEYLKSIFSNTSATKPAVIEDKIKEISIKKFAIMVGISKIASVIGQCNFDCSKNGNLLFNDDWFTWNFQPNINQNKQQFVYEIIHNLIIDGKALVVNVNNGFYVADSFSDNRDDCGFSEAIYYDVEKSGSHVDKVFKESEVLHYTFDNSKIRPILENALIEYSELLSVAGKKYRRSAFQKGIVNIEAPPGGSIEKQKEQDEILRANMRDFFNADSSVLPLRKGYQYEELGKYNNTDSSTDISLLTKEIFSRVAEALNMPVAIMRSDVLETKEIKKDFINGCIKPLIEQIKTENTRKLSKKNGILENDLKFEIELPPELSDFFSDAGNIDKYIYSGICSINEIRNKKGLPKLSYAWADFHFITKNYSLIEDLIKAGETNE